MFVPHQFARRLQHSHAVLEVELGLCVELQRENSFDVVSRQPAFGEDTQQQPPQHHVQVVGTLVKAGLKLLNELAARILEGLVDVVAIL